MSRWVPELSFTAAVAEARGIVGEQARLRYEASRPRDRRCLVGVEFEPVAGQKVYGLVAAGATWREALDRARLQVEEYQKYLEPKGAAPHEAVSDAAPSPSQDVPPPTS